MSLSILKRRTGARRAAWATSLFALFVLGLLLTLVSGAAAAAQSVPLGTADSFAVLAGSGIGGIARRKRCSTSAPSTRSPPTSR